MIIEQLKYKIDVDLKGVKDGVQTVKNESGKLSKILDRACSDTKKAAKESSLSLESFSKTSVNSFKKVGIAAASFLGIGIGLEAFRRGIVSTTNSMVDLGIKSSFLGMSAKNLDGFNRGFLSFGSNADKAQGALMKLQESSLWKLNPNFAQPAEFSTLEELSTLTNELINDAPNAEQALLGLSNAIHKLNDVQAMSYKMRLSGIIDDASFLAMRNGTFNSSIKGAIASSTISDEDIKKAMRLNVVMNNLNQSTNNLKNSFFLAFGDEIADSLQKLADWLIENKDGIIGFFKDMKEVALGLIKVFGDLGGVFSGSKAFSQTSIAQKINERPKGTIGYLQHPLLQSYYKGTLTQKDIDEYNKKFTKEDRDYFNNKYIIAEDRDKVSKAIDKDYTSAVGSVDDERYSPQFKPAPGEAVRDGAGGKYYATTQEYRDANGNIVNPVKTDVGYQSMDRILDAVAYRESRGNINAKNPNSSAAGLFQLTKGAAKDMGLRVDDEIDERYDPVKARQAAAKLIRLHLKNNNGNLADAMAAYAGGQGGLNQFSKNGTGFNSETINSVYEINRYLKGMNLENSKFHQKAAQTTSNAMNINTVNINNPVGELSQIQNQISLTKTNMAWG